MNSHEKRMELCTILENVLNQFSDLEKVIQSERHKEGACPTCGSECEIDGENGETRFFIPKKGEKVYQKCSCVSGVKSYSIGNETKTVICLDCNGAGFKEITLLVQPELKAGMSAKIFFKIKRDKRHHLRCELQSKSE